jgi:hypothetical protein
MQLAHLLTFLPDGSLTESPVVGALWPAKSPLCLQTTAQDTRPTSASRPMACRQFDVHARIDPLGFQLVGSSEMPPRMPRCVLRLPPADRTGSRPGLPRCRSHLRHDHVVFLNLGQRCRRRLADRRRQPGALGPEQCGRRSPLPTWPSASGTARVTRCGRWVKAWRTPLLVGRRDTFCFRPAPHHSLHAGASGLPGVLHLTDAP